jgi:transposase
VSQLISYVEQAAVKNGCTLLSVNPVHATRRCAECGELILHNAAKLLLTCPNGHTIDQDANAARNIFSKMKDDPEGNQKLRSLAQQCITEAPVIPEVLRSVIVERQLGDCSN